MTDHRRLRMSKLALGLVAALAAAPAFAQSTSAGVGGVVVGNGGQPVAGAEVTIVHVESGTVSRAVTDASGRYNARGLRVGGPYTVTVTKPGEGTKTEEGVYLNLNQVNTVNASLEGDVTTLQGVEVVGAYIGGSDVFSANKMGTGINVTREQMDALPSANRNMQDYIRLDPRISQVSKADGAISAGGQNTRFNAIRIDGIGAGDPFGLESNNFPTERQPVSMDAIQEINIDLANYDTTIFGGTGAVVNAVTKSGTNTLSGTVYATYRDKDMVRSRLEGDTADFAGFNDEVTYGATVGGPVVKDKLFFFANYEKYTRTAPGISLADTAVGRGNVTQQDILDVISAANAHGFDAGSLASPGDSKTEIEEYAVKLDWNINEDHRAALRYNKMEQSVMRFPGMGSSTVSLSSYWYAQPKAYETWMAEVFSDWSENFSTEFKASYKDYSAVRAPNSNRPSIQIQGFPGNSSVYLGTEVNTHVNIVESKELSLFAAANWYVGDHVVKFGFDHQNNDLMNFYGRNLNGSYAFSSLANFIAGTPSSYSVRAPRPNGGTIDDVPAEFTLKNTGVFLQDTWAVNYNLSLMYGVRVDIPEYSSQDLYNPLIEQTYGYDNTYVPDTKLVQPRVGFNYTFDSERPTQLRGGVGLFGGAAPNVWLSGAYSNTGLNYVEYTCNGAMAPVFSANPAPNIPASCSAGNARANVDIIEPGFKAPSVWKSNLAFDHELPWYGIVASAEALYTKVKDGIFVQRLDLYSDAAGNGATAYGPDGRPLFWNEAGRDPTKAGRYGIDAGTNGAAAKANRPDGIGDVLLVRNTDKGESTQLTVGLDKPLTGEWGWSLFYTYTTAKEVSPMTSSQNTSNWGNTVIGTVNENVAYDSRYAIKDRVTGQLHWQKAFFGDYKTKVSAFYEGRSGRPFSYIFYNDANGDGDPSRSGQAGYYNDLFYVPAGPGDVLWTGGEAMEQQFFEWLSKHGDLAAYQGRIAPANAFRTKWTNSFDVRISQELPGFMQGHKTEVSLDIMNIGNLLNKKWGLIEDYGFNATARVANYAGIDPATGKYVYNFSGTGTEPTIQENNNDKGNTAVSRWSVMLGIKYRF
ncbi:TonB-dependent outer membrane receptor [Pseudoxanthomonas suwonensis 11-1]|uniref:TonB-dependent outer membrane receptor n=2 Tax=Pseudoxanthomonas suwonensis TaxID=314722 RepID=E6WR25_PSEUU|nr:TonB-dependent outer membrane receptor [Pseudoxanthomonas suwonensis 11-1]